MKLTDNCYAVLGFGYYPPWMVNSGFIVGSTQTLIVDSGPNYLSAQTIYGYAKNIKPGNELIVINTEKHLDHIGGNSLFKDNGVKIFGHIDINRNDSELKEDKNYFNKSILSNKRREAGEEEIFFQNTKIVNPDFPVENNRSFRLGGGLEAIIIYTYGHTSTNISVFVPGDKVLYCGDCIVSGYIPNLEASNKDDWKMWLESLNLIGKLDINYIVPGHGKVLSGIEIIKEVERIRSILKDAINSGIAPTSE
ncbi:MAG: MBL fold metallo-hydrolase [Ignavibacteriaceae bacterium]|jgi:glyoxylase-like metal-dependent hydrolase (beta-lactamase superfamily II)